MTAVAVSLGACGSTASSAKNRTVTRSAVGTSSAATATRTATPSPTAMPDPLGTVPFTADDARRGLEQELLDSPGQACPQRLKDLWHVRCLSADLDRDGKPDTAFLIPLSTAFNSASNSAVRTGVVLVLRSSTGELESVPDATPADTSALGVRWFGFVSPSGGGPALSILSTQCTVNACTSQAHIEHWDGTAWRDEGPGDQGINNLESIAWNAAGQLVMKGGKLTAPGAGPTRDVTVSYRWDGSRYSESSRVYAAPVYLFHAITDADAKFAAADWPAAIAAYQAAIDDPALKDWKAELGQAPGNPTLDSYALFRVAVATAAMGSDPTIALDTVVAKATDMIFAYAAEQFRQGWLTTGTVHGGCLAATSYLGTVTDAANNPAYIQQAFNYGYANQPAKTYRDVCPL